VRQVFLAVLLGGMVTACATPYVPPREPPPPGWAGPSGMANLEAPTFKSGVLRVGDVISSAPVTFIRTGVLAETVQLKSAYGGAMIFPKGSKAYATNYTLFTGYGAPTQNAQPSINPIEWCIIAADGFDGKKGGAQVACAFWEGAEHARYMQDYGVGELPFEPNIDIGDASGTTGPVPNIVEQPVDFGVTLQRQLKIQKIEPKGVTIAVALTDGAKARTRYQQLRWSKTGEARLGDRIVFRPAPGDAAAVEIQLVR
jgi:hypothetical protein